MSASARAYAFVNQSTEDLLRYPRVFWEKIRRGSAQLPFAEDAAAAYYCALDYETPARVRAAILGALAYFVLPVDAVPDMLPVVGYADDAAVIAATLQVVAAHILPEHREAARRKLVALRTEHTKS